MDLCILHIFNKKIFCQKGLEYPDFILYKQVKLHSPKWVS